VLETTKNIIPTWFNKLIIAIYLIHHFNYYRGYMLPKIVRQASDASKHIIAPLELGFTPFGPIEPHICIFD
jgi:hypothetical protein